MNIERRTCRADDGVTIVYSASGAGEPALVFIHGGLAERSFWDGQHAAFSGRHRVIAPDLAGHGESGADRTKWGIPEFGADVRAVLDREKPQRAVLIGNSLGGPVAIEAALVLPGCASGVIGVDTFQSLEYRMEPDAARQRAEYFRSDYAGALRTMVDSLFHRDADPAVRADAERRMSGTSPETAYRMFMSFGGYDVAAAARRLAVPLYTVNGDLYATDLEGVRRIRPEFDVILMSRMGHYPMLERPEEFNRGLARLIARL